MAIKVSNEEYERIMDRYNKYERDGNSVKQAKYFAGLILKMPLLIVYFLIVQYFAEMANPEQLGYIEMINHIIVDKWNTIDFYNDVMPSCWAWLMVASVGALIFVPLVIVINRFIDDL